MVHADFGDGGVYACLVTNAAGDAKRDFFVDILRKYQGGYRA